MSSRVLIDKKGAPRFAEIAGGEIKYQKLVKRESLPIAVVASIG